MSSSSRHPVKTKKNFKFKVEHLKTHFIYKTDEKTNLLQPFLVSGNQRISCPCRLKISDVNSKAPCKCQKYKRCEEHYSKYLIQSSIDFLTDEDVSTEKNCQHCAFCYAQKHSKSKLPDSVLDFLKNPPYETIQDIEFDVTKTGEIYAFDRNSGQTLSDKIFFIGAEEDEEQDKSEEVIKKRKTESSGPKKYDSIMEGLTEKLKDKGDDSVLNPRNWPLIKDYLKQAFEQFMEKESFEARAEVTNKEKNCLYGLVELPETIESIKKLQIPTVNPIIVGQKNDQSDYTKSVRVQTRVFMMRYSRDNNNLLFRDNSDLMRQLLERGVSNNNGPAVFGQGERRDPLRLIFWHNDFQLTLNDSNNNNENSAIQYQVVMLFTERIDLNEEYESLTQIIDKQQPNDLSTAFEFGSYNLDTKNIAPEAIDAYKKKANEYKSLVNKVFQKIEIIHEGSGISRQESRYTPYHGNLNTDLIFVRKSDQQILIDIDVQNLIFFYPTRMFFANPANIAENLFLKDDQTYTKNGEPMIIMSDLLIFHANIVIRKIINQTDKRKKPWEFFHALAFAWIIKRFERIGNETVVDLFKNIIQNDGPKPIDENTKVDFSRLAKNNIFFILFFAMFAVVDSQNFKTDISDDVKLREVFWSKRIKILETTFKFKKFYELENDKFTPDEIINFSNKDKFKIPKSLNPNEEQGMDLNIELLTMASKIINGQLSRE